MLSFRKNTLILNVIFLGLAGFAQMVFELLSHFKGMGPLGNIFNGTPYTIGFFEAHGFAVLTSILVFTVMIKDMKPHWHAYLAAICFLLSGANILFWDSFGEFGLVTAGYVATSLHILFFTLHIFCYARSR
jgi:hypothetical protein